jgi:hypothetical protein
MWGALSDERTGLPFTVAAGPRHRSHSWIRFPRDSWPYFTASDSRLPNLESQVSVFISARTGWPPIEAILEIDSFHLRLQYPLIYIVSRFHCILVCTLSTVASGKSLDCIADFSPQDVGSVSRIIDVIWLH